MLNNDGQQLNLTGAQEATDICKCSISNSAITMNIGTDTSVSPLGVDFNVIFNVLATKMDTIVSII